MIDGKNGILLYQGYNIHDLAKYSTFEETSYLLIHGHLPNKKELDTFEINGLQNFSPYENLQLIINHMDGIKDKILLKHTFNKNQIEWFKAGSALNFIAKKNVK